MNPELQRPGSDGQRLTVAQNRIVRELGRLIGDGPAAFFRDACLLVALEPPLPTTTHLVAHLLREVESGVRKALEPPGVVRGQHGAHQASVAAVLESLGIAEGHKAAGTWLALADQDGAEGLAHRAHRSGLNAPRTMNSDFTQFVADVEELFDYVLDRCDKRYHAVFDRLDALASIPSPTHDDVKALFRCPQTITAVRHFLNAAGPQWVGPLAASGYFTAPPEPQPNAEGRIELLAWLPSDYLARMAQADSLRVVEAALTIPVSDNSRANFDLVRIALAVPADQAVRLAPKIGESLACKYGVPIPDQIGALAARLASGNHLDSALSLMVGLLNLLPGHPRTAPFTWEIAEIMRRDMPALVSATGMRALAIVCARLDSFIADESPWSNAESGSDMSTTWWPDLRETPPHHEIEPAAALAAGVYAACVQLLETDEAQAAAVFAELRTHPWLIYRRIRLHLLAMLPVRATDVLTDHLVDPLNLDDAAVKREYLRLAQARCSELAVPDRERVVGLIESGPDLAIWTTKFTKFHGHEPSVLDANQYSERWMRDRFSAFEQVLTTSARARHVALVAEHGPATEPSAFPGNSSPFAVAPRTVAELSAMSLDGLIEFLRDWEPGPDTFLGPDRSTLAGVLKEVIAADRPRWSADARAFADLDAVYVTGVLESLTRDNKEVALFDWRSVLDLCERVDELASREIRDGLDWTRRQWRDARLNTFYLISQGLAAGGIPEPEFARVWSMIVSGCSDPDPQPERERIDETPLLVAYNSVRTKAMGCVIGYALHRRECKAELDAALTLLAEHLEPVNDPSPALRTVYGANLPQLLTIAPDWVHAHLAQLLPPGERDRLYWDATWDAFLERGKISEAVLDLLRENYALAVARVNDTTEDQARALRTGFHLLTYYWNGAIGLDSSDGLLRKFYGRVSAEICGHLASFISHSLRTDSPPAQDVLERLTALWEFRVGAVHAGADPAELAEFGWWFASGFFEKDWAFGRVLHALKAAGRVDAVDGVLERLAALSSTHTLLSLSVLSAWAANRPHNFYMVASREQHIRTILTTGFRGDATEVDTATSAVGQLIGIGIDMRDADPRHGAA